MVLPLVIYFTPFRANWNCKNPVPAITVTALVSSSCYIARHKSSCKGYSSEKGQCCFCLCEAYGLMDVTFKIFVGNVKTVVSNFRLFPAEAVEYLSIHSAFSANSARH